MDRELTISLNLRKDAAERASAEYHQGERRRLNELVAETKAAEQKRVEFARESLGRFSAANRDAATASRGSWSSVESGVRAAGSALTSYAGQLVGLQGVQGVVHAIADEFKALRQTTLDAVKANLDYRESLLELAALKGKLGDTGTVLKEDLAFRARTLQTAAASRAFQEAALGAGESAITQRGPGGAVTRQGLIEQAEFTRLMEMAGSFQAVEGGDAATHGRLAGMIPMVMGRRNVTATQAFAEEQALYNIFKPGGGTFSQMTGQFLENAPLVTTGMTTDRRLAALLSAFSTTDPTKAGTRVQEFSRATVGSLGRLRGASIEGSVERQAEYLKRVGATDQMDMVAIGKLISADFTRQEQAEAARGREFKPMLYLQQHGYMNQQDIETLMQFHGMMKTGQFQNTFEPLAEAPVNPAEAFRPVQEAQRTEPVLQRRRGDIEAALADTALATDQTTRIEAIRRVAFERLRGRGEVAGTYGEQAGRETAWWGNFDPKNWMFGYKERVDLEAQRMLEEEAQARGVDFEHPMTGGLRAMTMNAYPEFKGEYYQPGYAGDQSLFDLSERVRKAGGEPVPTSDTPSVRTADEAAQGLKEAAVALKEAAESLRPKVPPPLESRPRGMAGRVGG